MTESTSTVQDVRKRAGEIPTIVIVDFDSGADGDLHAIANALQRQIKEQFALAPPFGWGLTANVRVAKNQKDVAPNEWVMGLYAHPDQPGALGYHDRTGSTPLMKVFPQLDMQEHVPWSTTASHEALETLLDPELSKCVQAPSGHFWSLEVCDFVEDDSYVIDGIAVSNFSLPPAFEPPSALVASTVFDWLGMSTAPFQIRPGGYGQWWDGRKWVQATSRTGLKSGARTILDTRGLSRLARRAKLHSRMHVGDPRFV